MTQYSWLVRGHPQPTSVDRITSAAGSTLKPSLRPVPLNRPGVANFSGQLVAATSARDQHSSTRQHFHQPASGTQSSTCHQRQSQPVNPHHNTATATSAAIRHQSTSITTAPAFSSSSSSSSSAVSMMRARVSTTAPATTGSKNIVTSSYTNTGMTAQHARAASLYAHHMSKLDVSNKTLHDAACHVATPATGDRHHSTKLSHNYSRGCEWKSARTSQLKDDFEDDKSLEMLYGQELTGQTMSNDSWKKTPSRRHQPVDSSACPDLSMRVWTCTVAMLKSWTVHTDRVGLVMFELYGFIDSAMVRDHSGCGKEFLLRDDTASITCVFYEIDRLVPRLIRGQVCRVVGSSVDAQKRLHIVSVRAALGEEQQVCHAAMKLSQSEMDKLSI